MGHDAAPARDSCPGNPFLQHLIRSFLKARVRLVLGQPLICSLLSLLFSCKFLTAVSLCLSHTRGPATMLQGLITLRDVISKHPHWIT